jgi:hypothetical protein
MPGSASRFAEPLDYARKGMAGGFSLESMICGKKGCRGRPHTSFPTSSAASGGKWGPRRGDS